MRRPAKAFVAASALMLLTLALAASTAVAAPPTVSVEAPTGVAYATAHLKGKVDPQGQETAYYFQYSVDPVNEGWSYGTYVPGLPGDSGETAVAEDIGGLQAGTQYFVRLIASNADGETISPEPYTSFTTDPVSVPNAMISTPSAVTGTTASFSGTIDPEAPEAAPASPAVEAGFKVDWRFECTPECPGLSGTVAADDSPHAVTATATGLLPNTNYEVRLVADNAGPAFTTSPQSFTTGKVAPVATTLYAGAINGSEATLRGNINPRNSAVTYQFEWGLDSSYGNVAPAAPTPVGAQDNSEHPVSAAISGLTPGATYHYRLVATNTETSAVTTGADRTFSTVSSEPPSSCPNQIFRVGFGAALPECRAYEQVSPVAKDGLEMLVESGGVRENFLVGPGGESAQYLGLGAFVDSATSLQFTHYLATRGGGEWANHGTDIPQSAYPDAQGLALMGTSKDLSHSVSLSHRALTSDAVPKQFNIYLRDNRTGALELIFTLPARPYMLDFTVDENIGGTPDYSHVLFRETQALTPDAIDNGKTKLYEYSDGQLNLVSYGPDGNPSPDWVPQGTVLDNSISADGSRIFYTLGEGIFSTYGLYERHEGQTAPVSVSQRTGEVGEVKPAKIQHVSPDGSVIYLLSELPLSDESVAAENPVSYRWLYRYEAGEFIDLTLDDSSASPTVAEGESIATPSGDYVYFREVDALKAWHEGQRTTILGDLSFSASYGLAMSGNGKFLAFSSEISPTGYDDQNPEKCGAEGCRQVYLYDADDGSVECVSCRSDGQLPQGPSSFGPAEREAIVTNDGRVFFQTPDPLVDNDINGRIDVYRYSRGERRLISSGTADRPSYLGGVSPDGVNAFFFTSTQLVGQDRDNLLDVYNARVGGGLAAQFPPEPPAACEGESCKGPAPGPPDSGTPGTSSFSGGEQRSARTVRSRCRALASKARVATRKAKAKPKGKQRQKALKQAAGLRKKASKCRAEAV